MPYERKGNCVYNKKTGEKKGCSDTAAEAKAYMRKLYLEESKDKEKDYHPDVYYINEAIRSLDILIESAQYIIPYAEHDELKTFFSNQMESWTDALIELAERRIEWYGDEDGLKQVTREDIEQLLKQRDDSLVEKIKGFFQKPTLEPIVVTKQDDGRTRVLLRVSNIFKDRHGEIITTEAHENYVNYVNETKDYPQFWLWHTPGTRWGQADIVYFENGFLTMSGLVDEGYEHVAEGLANIKDLGVSHGFRGATLQGKGYIDWYRTHEASPLPRTEAANIWTGVMLAKEASMGIDAKHRDFFKLVGFPDDKINEWDSSNKELAEILKEAGIQYKATEPDPEPTSDPVPDPEPKLSDVMNAINELNTKFSNMEEKQKEFEKKVDDPVAYVLEAAVKQGQTQGQPATKANDNAPNPSDLQKHDDWQQNGFAELFLGTGGGK